MAEMSNAHVFEDEKNETPESHSKSKRKAIMKSGGAIE